jgi:hypothetical protein
LTAAFGSVVYDPQPQIQFREHAFNTSTAHTIETDLSTRSKFRIKDLLQCLFKDLLIVDFLIQSEKFLMTYDNLPSEKRLMIEKLFQLRRSNSRLHRLRYVFNSKIHFNEPLEGLVFQLMLLLDLAAEQPCNDAEQTTFAEANYHLNSGIWLRDETACFADNREVNLPRYRGKNWVARHYVDPICHLFWRDALLLRYGN